jgi:tight adherence protein B
MIAAALALALSLLAMPCPSHRRLGAYSRHAWTPPKYLAFLCAAVLTMLLVAVGMTGVAAAATIVGATVEIRRRRKSRRRRCVAEATALENALEVLVGELRVGAHPVAAFGIAAEEVCGVVSTSLRTIAARARMGADVAAGMRSVAAESDLSPYWERMALCWQLAQSHGLAIAVLMQTAQQDIAARERFSARVHAEMAGARTTGAVLAGLPVLGIGMGQLIGARPLNFLLSAGIGSWLLVIGVGLACAGLLWSDRITGQVLK